MPEVVRKRAVDPGASFLVQAPAGSGKTELLTRRFLALLALVDEPESILAITFTRKAAMEMRNRIASALEEAASDGEPAEPHTRERWELARRALDRDRERGWNLIANPSRMRVTTIDALCASLARQMPWLSGFGASPQPEEKSDPLLREAAWRMLATVEEGNEAVKALLLHLDNRFETATELLVSMLRHRDQWLRHVVPPPSREEIELTLRGIIENALRAIQKQMPPELSELAIYCGRWEGTPDAGTDSVESWKRLRRLVLTQQRRPRRRLGRDEGFPPRDPRAAEMINLIQSLSPDFCDCLAALDTLPSAFYTDEQWALATSLFEVLKLVTAQLRILFAERGVVDFLEVSTRAIDALGSDENPAPLAYALDHRLQHLLVDEFQDTSYTQHVLLRRLIAEWEREDGRTLFAVGDPMQSIYRFREADVGLFLRARAEGMRPLSLEPLRLESNFRSSAQLVDWCNATFPRIFPLEEDASSGAVAFAQGRAALPAALDAAVHCHPVAHNDAAGEACLVADLVNSAQGTVAILVRARSHAEYIARELNRRGIAFRAVEMAPLGERPVVQDLKSLLRALLHPADRIAWLAALRAPWCGLELADLAAIPEHAPVFATLTNAAFSPAGRERVNRILPVLTLAIEQRRRSGLRAWLHSAWIDLGGESCLRAGELADANAFFDVLDSLDTGGDLDFARLDATVAKLYSKPDAESSGRVQLMSMHKAKGLEFDTVILPGLGRVPKREDARLLLWSEVMQRGSLQLLFGVVKETGGEEDPIYTYLKEAEKRRAKHESARLLYVAATRARRQLHLIGALNAKGKPQANSLLQLLWPVVAEDFGALENLKAAPTASVPATLRRLPAHWTPEARPEPLAWTQQPAKAVSMDAPGFDWAGDTLRMVGTVVHRVLQRIARDGTNTVTSGSVRAALSALGVPAGELDSAVTRAERAIHGVLNAERGQWVLQAHAEAQSELELTGVVNGELRTVILDRTFVDGDGVRWIVDYKTSAHEGGKLEAFLDAERERYREQLNVYAELLSRLDSRPIRLGLFVPLLNGWREWEWRPAASEPVQLTIALW